MQWIPNLSPDVDLILNTVGSSTPPVLHACPSPLPPSKTRVESSFYLLQEDKSPFSVLLTCTSLLSRVEVRFIILLLTRLAPPGSLPSRVEVRFIILHLTRVTPIKATQKCVRRMAFDMTQAPP